MKLADAALASLVVAVIDSCCCLVVLCIVGYFLFVENKDVVCQSCKCFDKGNDNVKEKHANNKSLKLSWMIFMFSLIVLASSISVWSTNLWGVLKVKEIDEMLCESILPKIYSTTYILANAFLYEFLNTRSDYVQIASSQIAYYKYLKMFTKLLARAVPFLSILTLYFWKGEIVYEDGYAYCVDALGWEISLLFLCLSIPTSLLYLVLFIWPLKYYYGKMKHQESNPTAEAYSQTLLYLMKKNTLLSVIAMTSTMVAMTIITYLSITAEHKAFNNIGILIADIDLIINLFCMCLMTDQWLPSKLKKLMYSCFYKNTSASNQVASNSAGKDINSPENENNNPGNVEDGNGLVASNLMSVSSLDDNQMSLNSKVYSESSYYE